MKLSVLLVGNFLSEHGNNKQFIEDLADYFQDSGWNVFRASNILARPLRLLDMVSTILNNQRNYAIVHVVVFSGLAFIWAETCCWIFQMLGKPYILSLHGGNLPVFARRWPGRVKRLLRGAGAVIAPSRYLLEAMRPYRDDIRLIPNPLEIKNYLFHLRSTPAPTLVWLRAFHSIYNPQLAPRVIANLCAAYPEITLTMIGPDKGDGALQETQTLIEKLGLQKHIQIVCLASPRAKFRPTWDEPIFLLTPPISTTPLSASSKQWRVACAW